MNVLLVLISLFLGQGVAYTQATSTIGKQSYYIKKVLDKYHYNAIAFDDGFSEKVFDAFITEIDPTGIFFYKTDIESLKEKYYQKIDDDIKGKTSTFFAEAAMVFKQRLAETKLRLDILLVQKIDWKAEEYLYYSEADYPAFIDGKEKMDERWRIWLKSEILEGLFSAAYHPNPYHTSVDSVLMYEEEAKQEVLDANKYQLKFFLENPNGYENYLATFYLNAIATTADPHTNFFSPNEQESFVEELSRDNYAFGFQLSEDEKGRVSIDGLTPGSAAWLSGELNKGDIVLKMQLGKQKILDLSVAGLDDVLLMFANSKEQLLWMEIKKPNGQIKNVSIEKGIIYVDEDVIKSVILKGEKKIGYITLPDFYTDWEDAGTHGCANDVAKILVKLQKESIDGVILDLRNNGGGSLKEAIDLAGIFINYGPISIVQDNDRDPNSIKDFNKGSVYDGPLVILVNGLSASASEIFSAAMQDYNRALIVGSTTYGKSTGQIIIPLDPTGQETGSKKNTINESLGFLKTTTSKYYRITKSTHQKEGVIPDVALPDVYDIYEYRESNYENALLKDSVDKKVYYTPAPDFPLGKLNAASKNRLNSTQFGSVLKPAVDSLALVLNGEEKTALNITEYQKQNLLLKQAVKRLFSYIEQESEQFEVVNNQYDIEIMEMNAYRAKLNEAYLNKLKKDIYIDEAYQILRDYIIFEHK